MTGLKIYPTHTPYRNLRQRFPPMGALLREREDGRADEPMTLHGRVGERSRKLLREREENKVK